MEYVEELRNGKVEFLSGLTMEKRIRIIKSIDNEKDCDTILKTIIPIFRNTDNWYEITIHIFKLIYLKREFEEDTKYLLDKNYIELEYFEFLNMKEILEKTSWGLDYIYNHLEELPLKVISPLITYLKDKNEIT